MPGEKHAWPNSAACWSPAMPLTGMPSSVTPKRPDDGRISGKFTPSTPKIAMSSSSHARRPMSHSNVRDAFDTSVAYVAGEVPQQPRVDGADHEVVVVVDAALAQQPAELGRAEVRIEHEPGLRAHRRQLRRERVAHVRRCAGLATPTRGAAARRSTATTRRRVSRWLVMPIAAIGSVETTAHFGERTPAPPARSRRRRARPIRAAGSTAGIRGRRRRRAARFRR